MFENTVYAHFSGAHQLRSLGGRCEELHGHNWKVEVSVVSDRLTKQGIVIDFGILKEKLAKIVSTLDHTYLNDLPCFAEKEPSSENIARYIFDRLKPELKPFPVKLKRVTAWESDTANATYFGT